MQMGEGVTGWVVEHKSVVALSSNAAADYRFKRFDPLVEDTYEAFCSVPLLSGGEVIGVINVHHREKHEHTAEEVSLLTFIGEQMGGAMGRAKLLDENARLVEETQEMKRQLETRKLVERAKGILQYRFNVTEKRPTCGCATRAGGCGGRCATWPRRSSCRRSCREKRAKACRWTGTTTATSAAPAHIPHRGGQINPRGLLKRLRAEEWDCASEQRRSSPCSPRNERSADTGAIWPAGAGRGVGPGR